MMHATLSPWSILAATGVLAAFHIGLYTLVGRERKSPYIINSVFPIFLLIQLIAALALIATLIPEYYLYHKSITIISVSACLLSITFVYSFYVVFRLTIRFMYFVDSINPKHFPVILYLRRLPGMLSNRPTYAHDPIQIPKDIEKKVIDTLSQFGGRNHFSLQENDLKSLAVAIHNQNQCNKLLAELGLLFLEQGFTLQYLTASRHPTEFIGYFRKYIEEKKQVWAKYAKMIVVIDAYSPHFGFIDSIYGKKTKVLEGLDVNCEISNMTYAGMHSASSRAFNTIHKQVGNTTRKPTLVVYEGTYSLTDLESPEQYRIFVRHVLPSERLWDGMFTVFVESSQAENDWKMLTSYTSMTLDLRGEALHPCETLQTDDPERNDNH